MELLPLGPVLFIDTAGIDDVGALGELRVARTRQVFDRTDLGVLVTERGRLGRVRGRLLERAAARASAPVLVVFNKVDLERCRARKRLRGRAARWRCQRRCAGRGVLDLRQALLDAAPADFIDNPAILGDLVGPGELAVLVVPIDKEAPKGRLILPQVQAIRDLLDGERHGPGGQGARAAQRPRPPQPPARRWWSPTRRPSSRWPPTRPRSCP